jgi:hypothetical protein
VRDLLRHGAARLTAAVSGHAPATAAGRSAA